jgi:hypothetical protein
MGLLGTVPCGVAGFLGEREEVAGLEHTLLVVGAVPSSNLVFFSSIQSISAYASLFQLVRDPYKPSEEEEGRLLGLLPLPSHGT